MTGRVSLTDLRQRHPRGISGDRGVMANLAVEAAHRANLPPDCGCGKTPCPNERLLDALGRFTGYANNPDNDTKGET